MRGLGLAILALGCAACPGSSPFTRCDTEPDLSGYWVLTLTPAPGSTLPRGDVIDAQLVQTPRPQSSLGELVWGTLTSQDKGFFDTLSIPQLIHNGGSKTGAVVGCTVKINVPVASTVTDDDVDNGPLRIALAGAIVRRGVMDGDVSTLIRVEQDPAMQVDSFVWTGVQR